MNDGRYKMKVTVKSAEENKTLSFELTCTYFCNPEDYGNGYHLAIEGDGFFDQYYDLRYDKSFKRKRKMTWLVDWAEYYWSGEEGAYKVTHIDIEEV